MYAIIFDFCITVSQWSFVLSFGFYDYERNKAQPQFFFIT